MRKMYSEEQLTKIIKENSTRLYHHRVSATGLDENNVEKTIDLSLITYIKETIDVYTYPGSFNSELTIGDNLLTAREDSGDFIAVYQILYEKDGDTKYINVMGYDMDAAGPIYIRLKNPSFDYAPIIPL